MLKLVLLSGLMLLPLTLSAAGKQQSTTNEDKNADAPSKMMEKKYLNIGSGGTAGTYFPLAGGLAEIWNKNIAGVNASAQSTGASVANLNLLSKGKVEVIFVQNDTAYYAMKGQEIFADKPMPNLRGMLTLYPETVQIISMADSGINTVADLRGKRVAIGAAGSGVEANARQILAAAGLTYDDIKPRYLSFSEAASNLKDRNIDAGFMTAGYPTAAVQDISSQQGVKLINIDRETIAKLMQLYPFYTATMIPAGTYNGVSQDVSTVSVMAMLAVDAKLDEMLVKEMLATIFTQRDRLIAAHKKGEMITKESARMGMSIPLHPGAKAYFDSM